MSESKLVSAEEAIASLQGRVDVLEKGGDGKNDEDSQQLATFQKYMLGRLETIKAQLLAEAKRPASRGGGGAEGGPSADMKALQLEVDALKKENTQLKYRINHLVREFGS